MVAKVSIACADNFLSPLRVVQRITCFESIFLPQAIDIPILSRLGEHAIQNSESLLIGVEGAKTPAGVLDR